MTASKAHMEATDRYNLKAYESVGLRVKKGTREEWRKAAEAAGKSLTQFIVDAVEHEIDRECL